MLARVVVLALVLGPLSAGIAVAQQPPDRPVAASIVDGTAQHRLDAARAQWRKAAFSSYREDVELSCFCAATAPRTVRVLGGRLAGPDRAYLRNIATVPRQFRVIQQAIDDRVSGLQVHYGSRGNPASVSIDPDARIADEESYYRMRHLTRLGR